MDYYHIIGAAIIFIENRVQTGIRYSELEKAAGFSLPHLRAVFARYTGQSLARYIMSRRIAWAAFDVIHTADTLLEISGRYGFSNPDTFTRAFRRVTGMNPQDFRKTNSVTRRAILCAGVYGVTITKNMERTKLMNSSEQKNTNGVVLYGVPKVRYGAFDGCTPYPICLKAVANYIGDDLSYEDAMVLSGAAFRLTWDTTCWNGGNVDVLFCFDEPFTVYKNGIEALGREFKLLNRNNSSKDDFIAFIKDQIDKGLPVIALGIIGPPEACVITGYRDGGQTLLGWNCFQDNPEFASGVTFDESGYFVTSSWWENKDTIAVMSVGEKTGEPNPVMAMVKQAITVLEGRHVGQYAKGIATYDAWKKAILDESQFADGMVIPLQVERLMCQGDGMDCVADGRGNAAKYFRKLSSKHPEQPLYGQIAEQFTVCANGAHKMYDTLGGWERNEAQLKALMKSDIRCRLGELLDECKTADEKALALMKELVSEQDL